MPPPLANFLNDITKQGSFVASKYLTKYELTRINVDQYGTIYDVTTRSKYFIWLYTIFGKCIIPKIFIDK